MTNARAIEANATNDFAVISFESAVASVAFLTIGINQQGAADSEP